MTEIPWIDLIRQQKSLQKEIESSISKVFDTALFAGGPFVKQFEDEFAGFLRIPHVVGVDNGTNALHLAMRVLNIGPGDEVIVPANTFIATAWAPAYAGAKVVFCDCTPDTWEIDIDSVEKSITPRTKAVMGVHLYGQPFDYDALKALCSPRNIHIVEDCAQAHGATYKGAMCGGLSEIGCFSFYPSKNLGSCGDSGVVATHNEEYAARVRRLRDHGSSAKYVYEEIGYNMRMDGLQAAILSVKLKHLDAWNAARKRIAGVYRREIHNPLLRAQVQAPGSDSVYYVYVVTAADRPRFLEHMEDKGIHCGVHYPVPCHLQNAFASLGYRAGSLPSAEYLSEHCVSIPLFPEMTESEVNRVVDACNSYQDT